MDQNYPDCQDKDGMCESWAGNGECEVRGWVGGWAAGAAVEHGWGAAWGGCAAAAGGWQGRWQPAAAGIARQKSGWWQLQKSLVWQGWGEGCCGQL